MKQKGFIKLSRGYFEDFLWNEARVYSRAEAWLDLIQMARFEASTEIINGKVIELQRGEIPVSRRFLELRWNWGSTKVSNFLDTLTKSGRINQDQPKGQTIIKLINYDVYNNTQTTDEPQNKPSTNHRQTTNKPPTNQNKEYKELKESKKDVLLEKEPKQTPEEIFDFEKVWNSFEGKKNSYEKDLKKFNEKTEGFKIDFRKLFYEAKKAKNIYFQTWINDIFPKSSKKVAKKKVSEIPSFEEFWEYTEKYIITKNLGPPENWKIPIEAKFNAWNENNWKDGNGKQIQNWKTKIQNTIPFLRPIKNNGQFNNQKTNDGFSGNSGNPYGSQNGKISARTILAQRLGSKTSGNNESGNITIDAEVVE
ncbi:hypothetical protein PG593_05250 [Riemerella anatipestifer]|nr:hypothetical protein [Riemerella anatipestifer]